MRFEKQVTVDTPRQAVWDFLWDVPRMVACVPGCDGAEEVEPGQRYRAVVQEKVGPFRVKIPLAIEVLETRAPERLAARASGRDGMVQSHVKVELEVVLAEDGPQTTTVRLNADVAVLGKLGTLGHSIIIRKGNAIVGQFATALQAAVQQEEN
jgi:carbon monoxide dehydrogenase subunit G